MADYPSMGAPKVQGPINQNLCLLPYHRAPLGVGPNFGQLVQSA